MVEQARAALGQAEWQLTQRHVLSPNGALVADTYARPGETINAGVPVVSLLPPQNILVRFFVPETDLATIHAGDRMSIVCDSCAKGLTATVSYIAPQPEYTPPVIYGDFEPRQAGLSDRGTPTSGPGHATQAGPAGGCAHASRQVPPDDGALHRRARPAQELRHAPRDRWTDPPGARRRDLRLPRWQRQRQDHDHPYAVRTDAAGQRQRHMSWPRPVARRCAHPPADRLHDAAVQLLRRPDGYRKPPVRRAPVRRSATVAGPLQRCWSASA